MFICGTSYIQIFKREIQSGKKTYAKFCICVPRATDFFHFKQDMTVLEANLEIQFPSLLARFQLVTRSINYDQDMAWKNLLAVFDFGLFSIDFWLFPLILNCFPLILGCFPLILGCFPFTLCCFLILSCFPFILDCLPLILGCFPWMLGLVLWIFRLL